MPTFWLARGGVRVRGCGAADARGDEGARLAPLDLRLPEPPNGGG
jgi:hypothetical protein